MFDATAIIVSRGTLHDARVYWSMIGVVGVAVAILLNWHSVRDRRDAIRGTDGPRRRRRLPLPRYLRVDPDNARDVQSWTALRRTVADLVLQLGFLAVRVYAITWREPSDPRAALQRLVGGWWITGLIVGLAVVGIMDYRDRCRLVANLRRHPDGDCKFCGKRVAEDDRYCPQCGSFRGVLRLS